MRRFRGFLGYVVDASGRKLRRLKPHEQAEIDRLWAKHADIRLGTVMKR